MIQCGCRSMRGIGQICLLSLLCCAFSAAAGRGTTTGNGASFGSLTPYESVRALDEFGNAKQLEYANNAANQQASLIVIFQHLETTWIVSVPRGGSRPAHQRRTTLPVIQRLSMPHWNSSGCSEIKCNDAFLICTGLQGDARWLTQRVRTYISRLWAMSQQRTPPTAEALAMAVASLMRLFWGLPNEIAIASPTLTDVVSPRNDPWARPMGLQVAVVALTGDNKTPQIFQINPAGNIVVPASASSSTGYSRLLCCMGAKNEAVRDAMERLLKKLEGGADDETIQQYVIQALTVGLGTLQGRAVYAQCLMRDGNIQPERILKQ